MICLNRSKADKIKLKSAYVDFYAKITALGCYPLFKGLFICRGFLNIGILILPIYEEAI